MSSAEKAAITKGAEASASSKKKKKKKMRGGKKTLLCKPHLDLKFVVLKAQIQSLPIEFLP